MSRRFRFALAAIVLVAAAVRLYRLDHFSFGLDEVMEGFWVRGTWKFFWTSLRFDAVHPPLDYLVNRFVETLNPGEALRRIPSVVWGLGTIAAVGALAARRVGPPTGLIAAALLAVAPFHVRYSQEYRPYSVGLFFLCASLLVMDVFLRRPSAARLLLLFLCCLATAYSLYLAAVALAVAAAALLAEDALSDNESRRRTARRFLLWSPLFGLALWLAYLPWWPVVLEAARRPAPVAREPLTALRAGQTLSFFAFAPIDGWPLRPGAVFYGVLVAIGIMLAARRRETRFFIVWLVAGLAVIELLGQLHPHWYGTRRYLPAGIAGSVLAAIPVAALLERPLTRIAGLLLLGAVVVLDVRGLSVYFREGRADWRVLADYLRREAAPSERVFTENQYAQLCLSYYLDGPDWLYQAMEKAGAPERDVENLEGEVVRLTWAWKPGHRAWLVLAGEPKSESIRKWAEIFPAFEFPASERATLRVLDPALRDRAFGAR